MRSIPRRPQRRGPFRLRVALQFHSQNPETTQRAAMRLATVIPEAGLLVVLSGPLGSGKTVFAKGLAAGLGIPPEQVTSPTFAICHEHAAPDGRRLAHADGYRLSDARELEDAGLLDWLTAGTLVALEWGERFPDALPADRLGVVMSRVDGADPATQRRVKAVASGSASRAVLRDWESQLLGDHELDFAPDID
ncbi:MAG: tRNA (adenosine(37)-N6)-threonylcarbamoyltransferase complex ATPase subunit type 1 TsaE [Myxococcota bacterium]